MKKIFVTFIFLTFVLSVTSLALGTVEYSSVGYDKVYPSFSDTVVVENDGKMGVVDRQGNIVVPFGDYGITSPDSHGRVSVVNDDGSVIYDKNGKVIREFSQEIVKSVADGICVCLSSFEYNESFELVSRVRYVSFDSGKVIYECDDVISATSFSNGYASIQKADLTVIIDTLGNEIFTDTAPLEPIGCPAQGIATFKAYDEYGDVSYYVIDIETKKRICIAGWDDFVHETNFTKTKGNIDFVDGFYLFLDKDNREVPVLDGVFAPVIEDPVYYSRDYLIVKDGVSKKTIDDITTFVSGEKYIHYDYYGSGKYYSLDDDKVITDFDGATGFSNNLAIAYDLEVGYVFVDENFEIASEAFGDFFSVHLFGNLFCGFVDGKYYFISVSDENAVPPTPSAPSTPSIPSFDVSGMKNFVKISAYNDSVFSDVKQNDWFAKNVALAYETGLMNGKEYGFAPQDNLTVAQVITMAARLNSIYNTGKSEFTQGRVWYQVYVDYCVEKEIIGKNDFSDYNRNTTRTEFVRILSRAIPQSEFELKNSVSNVPDVETYNKDYKAVLMFYRAGILSGSDSAHNFKPDSKITRAETAAIITRIIDKMLRVSFEIK